MEPKKAYGLVTAVGTKLGERARDQPAILDALRATNGAGAFRTLVAAQAAGLVPDVVLAQFLNEVITEKDWRIWKSRLLLQIKMVKEGGKPAPGHEAGRGVGRP